MRKAWLQLALAGSVLASFATGAQFAFEDEPVPCDRLCLSALADSYIAGLAVNDPTGLPFAVNVRFVENSIRMRIGQGLWRTATAPPASFRIYVPDAESGQVGFMGVMEEDGLPVILALRLRVENGRITEAEHLLARNLGEANLANLQFPRPGLLSTVPFTDRVPRDAMLDIGYSYYVALQGSNGSAAPFADDCVRRENGLQTTSNPPPPPEEGPGFSTFGAMGCAEQLTSGFMSYITRIDGRRVEIADEETGLVFGLSHFRHPMLESTIRIIGVPGIETWEVPFDPFDLPAVHIFKISGGEIHEIEAMGYMLPYDSPMVW